jgi:hypothetical protein
MSADLLSCLRRVWLTACSGQPVTQTACLLLLNCCAGPPAGLLPEIAAAHPEAYTALIDCCLRSAATEAKDMLSAADMLTYAFDAALGSAAALATAELPAGLASAVASLVKEAVMFNQTAVRMQGQAATAAAVEHGVGALAGACFPAAVIYLTGRVFTKLAGSITAASLGRHCPQQSNHRSCSSRQAAASTALLVVVLARSLVRLTDAMEAAGPQLLHGCSMLSPHYCLMWRKPGFVSQAQLLPCGGSQQQCELQWHQWQLHVLRCAVQLLSAMQHLGLAPATSSAAAASTAAREPHSGPTATASSSSSSAQQSKWDYLLQLQQSSPRWAAAVAAFDAASLSRADLDRTAVVSASPALDQVKRRYADAVELFRLLAAEAPLPAVCNHPSCDNLAGGSEVAAASKLCSGCRCRYCTAACQKSAWRRHRHACRRMAAAGQSCAWHTLSSAWDEKA